LYHLNGDVQELRQLAPPSRAIIITDVHVWAAHQHHFDGYRHLVLDAGEAQKSWKTIEDLAAQLLQMGAHRGTTLVGIGGGTITDITGFLASVYMRGIDFGFVPTTLLGMVDASIGGKNGINMGPNKNMIGTIRQPRFILHDNQLLHSLPDAEWSNGFAEVIKYGCIADVRILKTLEISDLGWFRKYPGKLSELIVGCVDVKNKIVSADEQESGLRKILNFGHTAAHAFERVCGLSHGQAVGLGMLVACRISEQFAGLDSGFRTQLEQILKRYGLPTALEFDVHQVAGLLRSDKKRTDDAIDFVVLPRPGVAHTRLLPFAAVEEALQSFSRASDR
jgi:3-dehydroquinate synthase